jgi:8-oxo-dGTP pyrophosphatase MutT (NUDIX family)
MALEVKIHEAQLLILRELLFHTSANYATLQRPTGLTSDHFNFHISRLVELGLVERIEKGMYRLTLAGKEYANKLDTDNHTIERQPKMAVMLFLEKEINGKPHFLIQQRLKNPHYGFYGFPTGKVRWGETILQTAQRELMEETGLTADFSVQGAYHEHTFIDSPRELIEDKLFFICKASSVSGELCEEFEGGKNQWLTYDEFMGKDKHFKSVDAELSILRGEAWLLEKTATYETDNF